jgi:enoyl-CoA hydratase/carnithine racemase
MIDFGPDLAVAVDGEGVAQITIRRPPDNYFDIVLLQGIADALEALAAARDARAVVLASEGRHFCAGAMLSDGRPDPQALYAQAGRIFEAPLPVVAIVHGAAIGGGLGLALAADFRVGSSRSRFSANFARLGFHQGFALSATLPAAVGHQRALELLLTGRRIDGLEAFQIGLLDRLVDADECHAAGYALALEMARSAPLAVASIRRTLRQRLLAEVHAALQREAAEQVSLFGTEDYAEGVSAMRDRRLPRFTGR